MITNAISIVGGKALVTSPNHIAGNKYEHNVRKLVFTTDWPEDNLECSIIFITPGGVVTAPRTLIDNETPLTYDLLDAVGSLKFTLYGKVSGELVHNATGYLNVKEAIIDTGGIPPEVFHDIVSDCIATTEAANEAEATRVAAEDIRAAFYDGYNEALEDLPITYIKGKRTAYNPTTGEANIAFGHDNNAISDDVKNSVIIGGGSSAYNNVIGGDGSVTCNTITPNAVTPGTGANVSVLGGYDNVAGQLSSKIISDHSYTEIGGDGHNAIYGGTGHIIKATASHSMIAGGNSNIIRGMGDFATGLRNDVSGTGSAAFGYDNKISNNGSFAIGAGNEITSGYSNANGSTNKAEGSYSSARGNYARSRTVSQEAFTGGRFAVQGDAQTSVIEMHRATTDAVRVYLGILGTNNSHKMLPNQSATFHVLLVARVVGGTDTAGWEIKGVAQCNSLGSSAIIGTPSITKLAADTGANAWLAEVFSDSTGGIDIAITGETGKTIRWVQRMTIAEVMI